MRECYGVLRQYMEAHGEQGIGNFIVSMTRSALDLLSVYPYVAGSIPALATSKYLSLLASIQSTLK